MYTFSRKIARDGIFPVYPRMKLQDDFVAVEGAGVAEPRVQSPPRYLVLFSTRPIIIITIIITIVIIIIIIITVLPKRPNVLHHIRR